MVFVSRLATACFIVALPLFLVTSNVRFLAGDISFYKHGFREYESVRRTGIAQPELDRSAVEIIDYFENDASTLRIVVNDNGQETSLFNAREIEHMKDVKTLMQVVFRTNEVTLAVVLGYLVCVFLWSGERPLRNLARDAIAGVGVGVASIVGIGVFAVAGFDSTWAKFHEIVFQNDFWKLNPDTDHLIQMFPTGFWEEATYIVGALTVAEGVLLVAAAVLYLAMSRKRPPEPGRGSDPAVRAGA